MNTTKGTTYLKSIADSEDRNTEIKDCRVDVRRILLVHGIRRSRQDDACQVFSDELWSTTKGIQPFGLKSRSLIFVVQGSNSA